MKVIASMGLISILSLVSCQKTYICDCEESYDGGNYHGSYSSDIVSSKKNKQTKCDEYMEENFRKYPNSEFSCTVN